MTHSEKIYSQILDLLRIYELPMEQRRIVIEASKKPLKHQEWFLDQFTRNR